GEDKPKRLSVTDVCLRELLISCGDRVTRIPLKPESPHCGVNRVEFGHDAKLSLHQHPGEAVALRRERQLRRDWFCRCRRLRVEWNTLSRICACKCKYCERDNYRAVHGV